MPLPFLTPEELEALARRARDCAQLAVGRDYKLVYQNLAQVCECLLSWERGVESPTSPEEAV